MAQAARRNLRMQKELKLLRTDPPPGVCFPFLSQDSDLSSFSISSIDAQIEGPEGTAYEKGLFKIKIQIPERYPFQPPIVTFATPIYHPNIDSEGLVCLDILNLPPKGAWQPSLNISSVLTSIGFLLSEPNPDDGLMREASKEYKHNRQAFEQKARSLTEKYARIGVSEDDNSCQSISIPLNSSMNEVKESDLSKNEAEDFVNQKSMKLSLDSSVPNQNGDGDKIVPVNHLLENQMEVDGPNKAWKEKSNESNQKHKKLQETRWNLSLQSLDSSQIESTENKDDMTPSQWSTPLNHQSIPMGSSDVVPVMQPNSHHQQQPRQYQDDIPIHDNMNTRIHEELFVDKQQPQQSLESNQSNDNVHKLHMMPQKLLASNKTLPKSKATGHSDLQPQDDPVSSDGSSFQRIKRKRLGLVGRKLTLGYLASSRNQEKDNKENVTPFKSLPWVREVGDCNDQMTGKCCTDSGHKKGKFSHKQALKPQDQLQASSGFLSIQDCSGDGKQSKQCDDGRKAGGIKPNGGSSVSETVIVSDSDDNSEVEESRGSLRSKLTVARKRLQRKQKAKACK